MKTRYTSTEQMPHITRKELLENFDEWLDKVEKEEIGVVVTEEGKEDLVLCPAKWFNVTLDDDFGCMVNCAVRYALGRETHMPNRIISFVKKHIGDFDQKTISAMIEDIEKHTKPYDNSVAYIDEWSKLADVLRKAGKKNVKKED